MVSNELITESSKYSASHSCKITSIFRLLNTFFTTIKADWFHDILIDMKIQVHPMANSTAG